MMSLGFVVYRRAISYVILSCTTGHTLAVLKTSESQARGSASCMHLFLLCRDKRFSYSPASSPGRKVLLLELGLELELGLVVVMVVLVEDEVEPWSNRKRLKASYPPGIR